MAVQDDAYEWFKKKLEKKRMTQVALAKHMGVDKSTMSLLLHGKRKMTANHAADLSNLLGEPVQEIMARAGAVVRTSIKTGTEEHAFADVDIEELVKPSLSLPVSSIEKIPLVGWIDGSGVVNMDSDKTKHSFEISGATKDSICLQFRTARTVLDLWDGWLAVTTSKREEQTESIIDRFCVVQVKNVKAPIVATVRRGYIRGLYIMMSLTGEVSDDSEIEWFSPITQIRPL